MGKVVGIDLGTTNSVVAVMEGGKPVVIANAEGMRTTPSVVAFSKEGERLVGQLARRQTVLNPQNTFYGVKRFMGRSYTELSPESKRVPYTIRRDENNTVKIKCPRLEKDFAPEEISAMILRKLAEEANRYLGQPITGAVITVPAYFNDAQRQATRDAGRIAGLEVKRILNEPTAAALAYGLDQKYRQTIVVFDLGGGTFDVSILEVGDGVFEVKATSGDTQLGGNSFDKKIVDWLAEQFLQTEEIDLRRDRQALQRLTEAAEKAKNELSGVNVTDINLPFITATADGPKHIETRLTRSQFEGLCGDLVSRLRIPLKQAFSDANLSPAQIDEVVLVGGASRMPMVQDLVRSLINREPNQNVNPDEVVAVGAAIQSGILTQEIQDILLLDVTPLSLGLETIGGVMKKLVPRNTTIPVRRSDIFSTSENNQTVVEVHVLQGEREMATDNKSLGRFKLMGIPPAPRGVPQVLVSLDIDANGILQVSALDKTTGREQGITVQGASNLEDEEVNRMIREAEEYSESDRLQRERVEKRNRSEALTFQAERVLREVTLDFGLQFARDRRRRIESLIQELRATLEQGDERGIDIAQAELQDELYELRREAYLYDEEEDEGNLFEQIGGTLRRTFTGDDDQDWEFGRDSAYYQNSSWDQRPKFNEPSWGYDDRRNPDNRYGRYDQYNQTDQYDRDDRYSQDNRYARDDQYNRDRYSQDDRYARDDRYPQDDRYARDDRYPQDDRYARDDRYNQDDRYARDDRYNQDDRYARDDRYNQDDRYARDDRDNQDDWYTRDDQDNRDRYEPEDRGVRPGDRRDRYDRNSGSYPPPRQSPNAADSRPNRYGNAHDEDWGDDDEWF